MTINLHDSETIGTLDLIRKNNKYYAYVGTSEARIFRLVEEIPPIGIKPISSEIPNSFILHQNYPNPFNPVSKIRFDIPFVGQRHAFDLQLVVYDILGREIEMLVNERLSAWIYEVRWNAESFPSGIYYYRLTAGEYTETRKMILIR
jgi:hypothetical protein